MLDSEIARRGPLTPHQMYEVVKKYEMYMARNKRLEGQSSSPSTGQQKTSGQTSNYKPCFHKTTAFAAKVEESEAQVDQRQEAQLTEEGNPSEAESSLDDDDGLYIPSYLEEAAPSDAYGLGGPAPAKQINYERRQTHTYYNKWPLGPRGSFLPCGLKCQCSRSAADCTSLKCPQQQILQD